MHAPASGREQKLTDFCNGRENPAKKEGHGAVLHAAFALEKEGGGDGGLIAHSVLTQGRDGGEAGENPSFI